ncbi:serine acetyltransferase [Bacillus pumilus]|nr:serine acetyltransferase [Bacillus pumilus]MDF9785382.1 serine acetyltransferase [Bacillus pumilus]
MASQSPLETTSGLAAVLLLIQVSPLAIVTKSVPANVVVGGNPAKS